MSVLTNRQMGDADRLAMVDIPGERLMEAAGWQVARCIRARFAPRRVVVLCGPGNNGGDGFVVARILQNWGWPVTLGLFGEVGALKGDAALNAARWRGAVRAVSPDLLAGEPLIVDALFGAGLARPLVGAAQAVIGEVARRRLDTVAVDVPSGLDGDTGQPLGVVAPACLTVTFFRPKPGHLLMPGRQLCGRLVVCDIGIPDSVLDTVAPTVFVNRPELWGAEFPRLRPDSHKYARGHLLVGGGGELTGAARLVAMAARRAGAGLVTVAAPKSAHAVYRAGWAGTMVVDLADWAELLADPRKNAVVVGPGLGVGAPTRTLIDQVLRSGKACVVDADGLTSVAPDPGVLRAARGPLVLTPHDGEYARLFAFQGDRLSRARRAAEESRAVVLLKGPDSVIAAPDGRAAINTNAPPTLATAGSGDVLAGFIGGLLAQGMKPFEAACAGAWLHGEAATAFGAGLVAEDLIEGLPHVLRQPSFTQPTRRMLERNSSTRLDR